jgi:lipid A 3-O-deacylase
MKKFFKLKLAFLFLFASKNLMAQSQEKKQTGKEDPVFLKVQWDNDIIRSFASKSDKYYTNGTKFDLYGNFLKWDASRYFLFKLKNPTTELYHLKFGQEIYTPDNLETPELATEDRPYAGWLYGTYGVTSYDEEKSQKLTSEVQVGLTGPLSFASEAQKNIHELTESDMPQGWRHQLSGNIGLNYRLKYEKGIWGNRYAEVIPAIEGNLGNINTSAQGSITFRGGLLNNYFRHNRQFDICPGEEQNKFRIFLTARPFVGAVAYNALLQGSLIGDKSPHALESSDLNRLYYGLQYGLTLEYGRFSMTVGESFQTPEFKGAQMLRYGSVGVRVRLN